jgi:hypothetical protein
MEKVREQQWLSGPIYATSALDLNHGYRTWAKQHPFAKPNIQQSMNSQMNDDPCVGNPRPENAGKIVAVNHSEMEYVPGKWTVVTVGDGTCDRDTVIHGLFWSEEEARLFASAMQTKKGNMPDDDWLTKVSDKAAQRMKKWRGGAPFLVRKSGT